jgi:hypothetical protein
VAVVKDGAAASALGEADRRDWQRHSVDVARLVVRLAVLGMLLALTAAFPSALQNVSADLVRLFARMPAPARYLLVGFAQLTILFIPAIIVWWVASRRSARTAGLVVGAAVAGGVVMLLLTDWLDRAAPPAQITDLPSESFVATDFPSVAYLAALVASGGISDDDPEVAEGVVDRDRGGRRGPGPQRDAGAGQHRGHHRPRQRGRFRGARGVRVAATSTGLGVPARLAGRRWGGGRRDRRRVE